MWGGTHFFVSIDVLLTTSPVRSSDIRGKPGAPVQRVLPNPDRRTICTSYPNAALLLQTLKATGNRVHVISRWSVVETTRVIQLFGWSEFIHDVRQINLFPGESVFTLPSIDCEYTWYSSSVLLVEKESLWHPLLKPQLVVVNHHLGKCHWAHDESASSSRPIAERAEDDNPRRHASGALCSMELLYSLCRCIAIAENRVRFPGTPIACCTALSMCTLFSFCRFYISPECMKSSTTLLISSHGGSLVQNEAEATHIVAPLPFEEVSADDVGSSIRSDDTSSEESSDSSTSTGSTSGSSDSGSIDSEIEEVHPEHRARANNATSHSSDISRPSTVKQQNTPTADNSHAVGSHPSKERTSTLSSPAQAVASQTGPASKSNAVLVSRTWLRHCTQSLRLLPHPVTTASAEVAEGMRTCGALLCTMLPPEDARPLLLDRFLEMADRYQYRTHFLAGTSQAETATLLQKYFGCVMRFRLVPAVVTDKATLRHQHKETPSATPKANFFLCRSERKRDRDAVTSHLRLLAAQFDYSLERVRQERRSHDMLDAGTQTSYPRFASTGVNTEAVERVVPLTPMPTVSVVKEPVATIAESLTEKLSTDVAAEGSFPASAAVKGDYGEDSAVPKAPLAVKKPRSPPMIPSDPHKTMEYTDDAPSPTTTSIFPFPDAASSLSTDDKLTQRLSRHLKERSSANESVVPRGLGRAPMVNGDSDELPLLTSTSRQPGQEYEQASPTLSSALTSQTFDSFSSAGHSHVPWLPEPRLAPSRTSAPPPTSIFPMPPVSGDYDPTSVVGTISSFLSPKGGASSTTDVASTLPASQYATHGPGASSSPPSYSESISRRSCFLPADSLSEGKQMQLLVHLQKLPQLSVAGASIETELTGYKCVFATERDADEFFAQRYFNIGDVGIPIQHLPREQPSSSTFPHHSAHPIATTISGTQHGTRHPAFTVPSTSTVTLADLLSQSTATHNIPTLAEVTGATLSIPYGTASLLRDTDHAALKRKRSASDEECYYSSGSTRRPGGGESSRRSSVKKHSSLRKRGASRERHHEHKDSSGAERRSRHSSVHKIRERRRR